ncbi:MAG: ribonuclease H-like domain-containing protein [Anaerolineae bacterium]
MDAQDRIARLLQRGRGPEAAPITERHAGPPLESLVPGYWLHKGRERLYVGEMHFALSHRHGTRALGELTAAGFLPGLFFSGRRPFDLSEALFLDTETTGLGRGPGTFCFMVGTGRLEQGHLVVRQYMAPDYGHEALLLRLIDEQASLASGLVSFNGRTFDLPVLETRYILNGYDRSPLHGLPHLDLLPAARRLWKRVLPSCALGALESHLLGVERGDEDIPGYLIPGIYSDYLTTGNTEEIARVFYHNCFDVLSMVTLAAEAADALAPRQGEEVTPSHDPVALGRIREADDARELAAHAYRAGLLAPDDRTRGEARQRLASLLKRTGQVHQAATLWLEALDEGTLHPYVELAKYYEHTLRDYPQAELLVRRATQGIAAGDIVVSRPADTLEQLARRLARLQRRQQATRRRARIGAPLA